MFEAHQGQVAIPEEIRPKRIDEGHPKTIQAILPIEVLGLVHHHSKDQAPYWSTQHGGCSQDVGGQGQGDIWCLHGTN